MTESKPCRSPYCECEKDKCSHPGFHDARHISEVEHIRGIEQRKVFEKWYGENYSNYALQWKNGDKYDNLDTELAWRSWQAAEARSKDAERYRKLRRWMSSNVEEGWGKVKNLGAIACYVDWNAFDEYLDDLPECTVGLCSLPKE